MKTRKDIYDKTEAYLGELIPLEMSHILERLRFYDIQGIKSAEEHCPIAKLIYTELWKDSIFPSRVSVLGDSLEVALEVYFDDSISSEFPLELKIPISGDLAVFIKEFDSEDTYDEFEEF
jgi:hypothetical protein